MRPIRRHLVLAALTLAVAGCATSEPDPEARRQAIDQAAEEALARLYKDRPEAREVVARARGVLVFPEVRSAGLVIGGSYGEGVLRIGGRPVSHYVLREGAVGIVAGAQKRALYFLFMEQAALQKFHESSGWTAGVDASVTMVDKDYGVGIDTLTRQSPVLAFAVTLGGLMANVKIEGSKISRLDPEAGAASRP